MPELAATAADKPRSDRTGGVLFRSAATLTENLGVRVPAGYRAKVLAYSEKLGLSPSKGLRRLLDRGFEAEGEAL
jgi:hypothetical protein